MGIFACIAGAGIAPALQGYEPRDVLLVHPARRLYIYLCRKQQNAKRREITCV